jgi:hypothetical protein
VGSVRLENPVTRRHGMVVQLSESYSISVTASSGLSRWFLVYPCDRPEHGQDLMDQMLEILSACLNELEVIPQVGRIS